MKICDVGKDLSSRPTSFMELRAGGYFFVDKSRFIRMLELGPLSSPYIAWLRPRRFGKSLLLSMLSWYYDLNAKDQFDALFGDLDIGKNPTPERSKYLIFRLEFTGLNNQGTPEALQDSFTLKLREGMRLFVETYAAYLPPNAGAFLNDSRKAVPSELLFQLMYQVARTPYQMYVLIDEYDNFTNDLVFRGRHTTYEAILHGAGFMREFFKGLKEGAAIRAVARIFITGVSPVTIDDLGSGANIFDYPYLDARLEAMCGFTEDEVRALVKPRLQALGQAERLDELMQLLRYYYNGYRFSSTSSPGVFNPDMILYFLKHFESVDCLPKYMLDDNLRMDYGKLRALMKGNQASPKPENVETLLTAVSHGDLQTSLRRLFPLSRAWDPSYFSSLLFYHGMLTFHPNPEKGTLAIPNFVIKELLWENVRDMLEEVGEASVPLTALEQALRTLGRAGDPLPFLRLIQKDLFPKLSSRDLIRFNEPSVKLLLLSWLSLHPYLLVFSELEHIGGYSDLILVPNPNHPWVTCCTLLELKYLKLKEFERRGLEAVEEKMQEGETQLLTYADDPRLAAFKGRRWTRMTLVFAGSRQIFYRSPGDATQRLEPEPEEDRE